MALDFIGANYIIKNNIDSAFFYFNSALSKAINYNDSDERAYILQNMGATFLLLDKNDEAKIKLIEAQKYIKDTIQMAKINLNLARAYANSSPDSSSFYILRAMELAQKIEDKALLENIYFYLSLMNEKNGNYKASLEHYKKYTDCASSINGERQKANYLDVQKKYNYELLENQNKKLVIERLWISISLLLVICVLCFFFFRHRSQNIKALFIATQQINQLKEMVKKTEEYTNGFSNNSNEEKNDKLRNTLFQQLDLFKKISLIEAQLQDEEKRNGKKILEKMNKILYQKNTFDWKIFYQSVNALYDNYMIRLKESFPELSEEAIIICCLSKSGFNNKEIALLTDSNQNLVQKKKTVIREKIGMIGKRNFVVLLDEMNNKDKDSMKIDNHFQ